MSLCDKAVRLLVASVLAAVLIGCSQQKGSSTQAARIPATPFSVVATGDSNFDASQARTFSWSAGLQELSGVPRLQDVPFRDC